MPRNPKREANLKPIKKGDLSEEELKKRQRNGGIKSGQVRREKRDARKSARYILGLAAKGATLEQLVKLGASKEDGLTNMELLTSRLFVQATGGDLDAAKMLLRIAGYDSEENRKERESLASDRRRDLEVDAKVKTLGQNPEGATIAINQSDEDGNSDVVIYLPKLEPEEDEEDTEEYTAEYTEEGTEEETEDARDDAVEPDSNDPSV